ncbi:MAG TPA: hypothetical protein PLB72_07750 [Bacteroidia bacterium]|nr:hypothetical protein [Bacteroidia bacterium]HRU16800.1 hypothetical protein [Bacteroidia bacterium]
MKVTGYVLLASLAINAVFAFNNFFVSNAEANNKSAGIEAPPCACDDALRYDKVEKEGGGEWISTENGKAAINKFYSTYKTAYKGAFFSKRALDEIFCKDNRANGIVCYFGQTGEKDTTVTLLIEGTHSETTLIKRGEQNAPTAFIATVKCPVICSPIGQ